MLQTGASTNRSGGFLLLSLDPVIRSGVAIASARCGREYIPVGDLDAVTRVAYPPRAIVIDSGHAGVDEEALRRIADATDPAVTLLVLIARDALRAPAAGMHVVSSVATIEQTLALADRSFPLEERRPMAFERLLGVSVLTGPIDQAIAVAGDRVAVAFGIDRCIISLRGDSSGGIAVAEHTWQSAAWGQAADACRAAVASEATLIVPGAPVEGAAPTDVACESYLAVSLAPASNQGFIGVIATRPLIFTRADRVALQALAARLGQELAWRQVYERTAEEHDRLVHGPGLDLQLGIWNSSALEQLLASATSAAHRTTQPLVAVVFDVIDLAGINTRHGLEVGDRVLRRICDALRATFRTEDIIGRCAGGKIAAVMPSTMLDGARRAAERVTASIAARPLELPGGGTLAIPFRLGVALLEPAEEPDRLIQRALSAVKRATPGEPSVADSSSGRARSSGPIELGDELRGIIGGTYRLLHEISRGGMGVVYRAEDLALQRPVAIKMLRPDLADDRMFVDQLRSEAALLARLQHPNLVQIYNFGQVGGDSYFVMELVEGESLFQAIERHTHERTSMPLVDALAAIQETASALDALHERGIIHRDVKPANVIRDPFRGRSVLVDVGIAGRQGQHSEIRGTPGYIAPEVMHGKAVTPSCDVYGLAATAYVMLTLTEPFGEGDHMEVVTRQIGGDPPVLPSTLRPELEPADRIILGALAKDPKLRPASAGAFARSLAAAFANVTARPRDGARWVGNVLLPQRSHGSFPRTRGVVFRSIPRALGVRNAERLREMIGESDAELASAFTDLAPLGWFSTKIFTRLLAEAPRHIGRETSVLARDLARASVRASFRRFFPASSATLVPERTLSAVRNVWSRYQTWGQASSIPISATEMLIRFSETLREPALCAWTGGMLEQLIVLSGGHKTQVDHEICEARGDNACVYRVRWSATPPS